MKTLSIHASGLHYPMNLREMPQPQLPNTLWHARAAPLLGGAALASARVRIRPCFRRQLV